MEEPRELKYSKFLTHLVILFISTIIVLFFSLSIGSVNISISEIFNILLSNSNNHTLAQIILEIRLPRVLYALFIGGGLSIAGAVFQAILMNPLAEPYILGISSGGTFGALIGIFFGFSFFITQSLAFGGAILVMILVFSLGNRFGDLEPNTLLLSGVMIGAFFSASILLLILLLGESLRTAVFWMTGSLSFARPENLIFIVFIVVAVLIFLIYNSYKYNILTLGKETSISLGINPRSLKKLTYFVASILIAAIVSVSGIIGFVGLLIPHACRLIWGVDNRIIIPASFLVGAIYLMLADTLARTIILPSEIPVGVITAVFGAPLFIYLLRRRFSNY